MMNKLRSDWSLRALVLVIALAIAPTAAWAQDDWQNRDLQQMHTVLDLMTKFFGIIENMHEVSSDAERAAVFQLFKIEEIYKERGERAQAIRIFEQVLEDSDNLTIRNAAYLMLGEALKETGRTDEAVAALQRGLQENLRNAQ